MRNTLKNPTPGNWAMPGPRTIHYSLFEALAGAHLGEVQHEAMVVVSATLLIVACWFFL
jgi:hypothetical protein